MNFNQLTNSLSRVINLSLFFAISSFELLAQQKTPYTDYIKENYSESYDQISAYILSKNPDSEEKRIVFLTEYQCKALKTLLQAMNEEGADFNILYRSIENITESTASERQSMDFWTWPKTDWVEVEYDYFFTLDTQE